MYVDKDNYLDVLDYLKEQDAELSAFLPDINFNDVEVMQKLTEYYKNIDGDVKALQGIKKIISGKVLKKGVPMIGVWTIGLAFVNPLLGGLGLALGSAFTVKDYIKSTKGVTSLIKNYDKYHNTLSECGGKVAAYERDYIAGNSVKNVFDKESAYIEIIELISALDIDAQRIWLGRLQIMFETYKNDEWQFYIEMKEIKRKIFEESRHSLVDPYFIVDNLLEFFKGSEGINESIINDILFHINNVDLEPEKERYYLEVASICLEKLVILDNEELEKEFNNVPKKLDAYLQEVIFASLKNDEEYLALKNKIGMLGLIKFYKNRLDSAKLTTS